MDKITKSVNVFNCSSVNTLLLNQSCKIMNGKNGGGFYARYRFEQNRGIGFIELLIQYPDESIVPVLLCKNVCRVADINSDGVGKSKPNIPDKDAQSIFMFEEKKGKKLKEVVTRIEDALLYSTPADYREFVKYERPDFPIPMQMVWKQIIEHWNDLPILSWNKDVVIDDVYKALITVGENSAAADEQLADAAAVYLTRAEIEDVANEFNFEFNVLRQALEARGLWCKDKNSKGYQFTKKVDGKNKRFYKLKKIDATTTVEVKTDFCIDYCNR